MTQSPTTSFAALAGRVALITGASTGIGGVTARKLKGTEVTTYALHPGVGALNTISS